MMARRAIREQRDLVGTLPDVSGRTEIDRRVAAIARKFRSGGRWAEACGLAYAEPTPRKSLIGYLDFGPSSRRRHSSDYRANQDLAD